MGAKAIVSLHSHLQDEQVACGRDRTLKIMQNLGIAAEQKKRFNPQGTDSSHRLGFSPNLLKITGVASKCDQVWVCDTTYLMTKNGWHI